MRLMCLSSFRTNTFESEADLKLTDRDLSVASIVCQVARSVEPDLDTPSTQPPKPARSSRKLISRTILPRNCFEFVIDSPEPLLLPEEERSENGARVQGLGEVNLGMEDLLTSSDEGGHIASASEQNSVLSELHRGRMKRFLNCSKNEPRVPRRFTSWKKKAHRKDALQGHDIRLFEGFNSVKRSLSTTSPTPSQIQIGSPLTIPSENDLELDSYGVNSATTFNRPFTLEEDKENDLQNQDCVSVKRRSMMFTTKWNLRMCSAPLSKRSRTLKEKKTCSENENKETTTTTTLQKLLKTTFKFWRPAAST